MKKNIKNQINTQINQHGELIENNNIPSGSELSKDDDKKTIVKVAKSLNALIFFLMSYDVNLLNRGEVSQIIQNNQQSIQKIMNGDFKDDQINKIYSKYQNIPFFDETKNINIQTSSSLGNNQITNLPNNSEIDKKKIDDTNLSIKSSSPIKIDKKKIDDTNLSIKSSSPIKIDKKKIDDTNLSIKSSSPIKINNDKKIDNLPIKKSKTKKSRIIQSETNNIALSKDLPVNITEIKDNLADMIVFIYGEFPKLDEMKTYYKQLNQEKNFFTLSKNFNSTFKKPIQPFLTAMASTETDFNTKSYHNGSSATGLGQITKDAAIDLDYDFKNMSKFKTDFQNPLINLTFLVKKLTKDKQFLQKYSPDNSVSYFESAYNAGSWNVIAVKSIFLAMQNNQNKVVVNYGNTNDGSGNKTFNQLKKLKKHLIAHNYNLDTLTPELFFTILSSINPQKYQETVKHYLRFNSIYYYELLSNVNNLKLLDNNARHELELFYTFAQDYSKAVFKDKNAKFMASLKSPIITKNS